MSVTEEHTVELYCGPEKSFSSIASFLGYRTSTLDPNPEYRADVIATPGDADPARFPQSPVMSWMAPPSEGFDDKSGWDWGIFSPVTEAASHAEESLRQCLRLSYQLGPKWWFLEMPKSCLRRLPIVAGFNRGYPTRNRYTIKPEDFGGEGKKEIDIYTNAFWWRPGLRSQEMGSEIPAGQSLPGPRRAPPSVYLDMLNQYDDYLRKKGER